MRSSLFALAFVLVATPVVANAGMVVEASAGRGTLIEPSFEPNQGVTSFMIAPGYGLGEVIRLALGVVWDVPEGGEAGNFRLRPMLTLDPPLLPIYGRLIFGFTNLTGDGGVQYEVGGALGVGAELGGIGLFAELGVIPEFVEGERYTTVEGRGGLMISF
jgi:hypothetical protein